LVKSNSLYFQDNFFTLGFLTSVPGALVNKTQS